MVANRIVALSFLFFLLPFTSVRADYGFSGVWLQLLGTTTTTTVISSTTTVPSATTAPSGGGGGGGYTEPPEPFVFDLDLLCDSEIPIGTSLTCKVMVENKGSKGADVLFRYEIQGSGTVVGPNEIKFFVNTWQSVVQYIDIKDAKFLGERTYTLIGTIIVPNGNVTQRRMFAINGEKSNLEITPLTPLQEGLISSIKIGGFWDRLMSFIVNIFNNIVLFFQSLLKST